MGSEYKICKEACENEGCYLPPEHEFYQKIAQTPAFIRAYYYLKGKQAQIHNRTKMKENENK